MTNKVTIHKSGKIAFNHIYQNFNTKVGLIEGKRDGIVKHTIFIPSSLN